MKSSISPNSETEKQSFVKQNRFTSKSKNGIDLERKENYI